MKELTLPNQLFMKKIYFLLLTIVLGAGTNAQIANESSIIRGVAGPYDRACTPIPTKDGIALTPQVKMLPMTEPQRQAFIRVNRQINNNTNSFTCTDRIVDGGFETGGIPNTNWPVETSTNFGTPLCNNATCGTGGGASPPRTGLIWAWFGGIPAAETATLGQTVTINPGTATLTFWMRIGTVTTPFTDVLNVKVDGVTVQSYPEPTVAEGAYTQRTINLNAYANGLTHAILFQYIGPTTGTGSYVVDDVQLNNCVASCDLAITKTDGTTTYTPGLTTTYTITASNAGPDPVIGATVADIFPASVTSVAWTAVYAGGATGPASGAGNINATVNIPVGGSAIFTAVSNISAAATGSMSNTATISTPAGTTDPTPGNNSATDTDTQSSIADLTITKTDGVTSYLPGGTVTYTIVASNIGPSNVTGATVTDAFPPGISSIAWTAVYAGGATGTASGVGNINVLVNMPSGSSVTFTAVCNISALATGSMSNTATVTAPAGVTDPAVFNNSATDTDTQSSGVCAENFDLVAVPALPTGWTATTGTACAGSLAWKTVNTASSSAPNSASTNDPSCISDEYLDSKVYTIAAAPSQLIFKNSYNLEASVTPTVGFDGMVLEISINGGAFADILTAGGTFAAGGYNRTISNGFGSPIANRQAWSGNSAGFITTTVNLPAAAQGQPVKFRWRRASDNSVGVTGAFIDDVFTTPDPATVATIAYAGSPYCQNAGTATVTQTGAAGGVYTSTAGLVINAANGAITLGTSTAGTYTVTYTVTGTCNTFLATTSITITTAPAATISYAGSPYCSSAGTATVTQTGTAGGTYSSTAGLTINGATGTITLGTSTAGPYTVTYTIAAAGGCAIFTTTTPVTITAQPAATISYAGTPYCSSAGTATVTQTGTAGGTYSSTAGLTINAATGAITLGTSTAGPYTVTYTIAAAGGCAIFTTTTPVTITAQPAATIAYAGSPYCSSAGTATVTQTGTAGGAYSSTAGLTINAATGAVTLGTSTPGTYTVTYTVAAAGGCAVYTTTTSITITAQPAATIAYAGTPYCSSAGTANSTQTGTAGGTYSSAAGLSVNAATGAVTLATSTAGTYTVTYTVAAAGGCSVYTTTTTITVTAQPAATIAYTAVPYCTDGGTATVTRTGTAGGTYSSAPAGLSINAATGAVTLATSTLGTYTVTYTVAAAGGCSVYSTTTTITINAPSVAPTSATASNPNMCTPGGITNLTETGGVLGTGASYKWYLGSCGGTPVGTGATLTGITVTATTTFFVRAEGICGNTACASVTVTVNPTPTVILLVASGFPNPGQTNPLHPSGLYTTVSPAGNYTYAWTLNGTPIATTASSITPANALFTDFGVYAVTVTNTATGCFASSNSVSVTDIVNQRGQLFISPNPGHSYIDIHYYSSTTGVQARTVCVFTPTGQRVMYMAYTPSGNYGNMTMDISRLPQGTYMVVLLDGANKKIASAGLVKL